MTNLFFKLLMTISFGACLVACGSSDDKDEETSYSESYVQFYNGSAASALTYMRIVDGKTLGSAVYGDVTSLLTVESGNVGLEFYRQDSDNKEVIVDELQVNFKTGQKSLLILSGQNQELSEHTFAREELTNKFRLFASSVVEGDSQYDVYMADAGESFTEAHKLGTLGYQDFTELSYWGGSAGDNFSLGDYVIYLTLPGQTSAIFQSTPVKFSFSTEYALVIRATAGANSGNLEVDLVANSSSVATYPDVNESAQYRVYNSIDASLSVTLAGSGDNQNTLDVAAKTISDFNSLSFGNYRLSASLVNDNSVGFNNHFVTLNQGESKALVLYYNADNVLSSLAFNESTLPQSYQFQIEIANLITDFSSLEIYFIRANETLDTAKYHVSALNFAKTKSITLPDDNYEILVLAESEGTQLLLERSAQIAFEQGKNHIISLEKDSTSAAGYAIRLLN